MNRQQRRHGMQPTVNGQKQQSGLQPVTTSLAFTGTHVILGFSRAIENFHMTGEQVDGFVDGLLKAKSAMLERQAQEKQSG